MNVIIEDSEIKDNETVALSHPTCKQICMFLSDYAAWLLGCGATCIRLEKNVNRIAHTFDKCGYVHNATSHQPHRQLKRQAHIIHCHQFDSLQMYKFRHEHKA